MIRHVALVALCACSKGAAPVKQVAQDAAIATAIDAPALPEHASYPTLASALDATIPKDARVVGVGEIHAQIAHPVKQTSLAAFTQALSGLGERISDLVVETWVVDPKCGQTAVKATKKLETTVQRPAETKNEIAVLADAARTAKIQPHAMTLSCKDYDTIAPKQGDADPVAMLTLTTKELSRIAKSAVAFRDKQATHRPWVVLYGGALHNDLYPDASVAEWSYATALDELTQHHYVELDVIVPELAEASEANRKEPWFPLVVTAKQVTVWKRGERSFVVILPRT